MPSSFGAAAAGAEAAAAAGASYPRLPLDERLLGGALRQHPKGKAEPAPSSAGEEGSNDTGLEDAPAEPEEGEGGDV